MEPRLNGIWLQTGLRPASKLDIVMEFGRYHAPNRFGGSSEPASVIEFGFNIVDTFNAVTTTLLDHLHL